MIMDVPELEISSRIKEWVDESKALRIFVFGKTGAGKSSLINTLLGIERAEEGASIYSQTKAVESYTGRGSISTVQLTINDVEVTIWDSPGLRDPFADEKMTIEEIQKNCQDVDIFIYCTPLNQTRIEKSDFDSISALSNGLGNDIWDKALIALTFADKVDLPQTPRRGSTEQQFKNLVSEWSEALRCAIVKAGVKKEIAETVPIVTTSYRDKPIPGAGKENWFSVFWSECLKRMRLLSLPAVLKIQKESMLVAATFTLREYFNTKEFKEDWQKQIKTASGSQLRVLLEVVKPALEKDPTYFVNGLAHALGISPSALVLERLELA